MQLNYDCIRDLLLVLEENLRLDNELNYPKIYLNEVYNKFLMNSYSLADIAYTASKLKEAGFINADIQNGSGAISDIMFVSLTYAGHQYLNSVRDINVWQKIKSSLSGIGVAVTVELVTALANKFALSRL